MSAKNEIGPEENEIMLEEIVLLESNIDHLTGEEVGAALASLNEMPCVLDAAWLHALGKKNRPCGILSVVCKPENEGDAVREFFRHTHTLGIRRQKMQRYVLKRRAARMPGSGAPAKAYLFEGVEYLRPEADWIMREAREKNLGAPALRIAKTRSDEED